MKTIKGWTERYTEQAKEVIETLITEAFYCAQEHGFHEQSLSVEKIGNFLALKHSELSEALEELRDAKDDTIESLLTDLRTIRYRQSDGKPEGFTVELADCVIRIFDTAGVLNLPLWQAIEEKMIFNRSRPFKHGRNC